MTTHRYTVILILTWWVWSLFGRLLYPQNSNDIPNVSAYEISLLYDLYISTNGAGWIWQQNYTLYGIPWNFTTNANPCQQRWQGIICRCQESCSVANITLKEYNLDGTIPPSIGLFPSLLTLYLKDNFLYSTVPSTIGNLSTILILDLSDNFLTGSIPVQVGNLSMVNKLSMHNNLLEYSIPESICNLKNAFFIKLYGNLLTGTLPAQLTDIPSLFAFDCSNNALTGSIPSSYGNYSKWYAFIITTNLLTGTIGAQLTLLPELVYFDISTNLFSGTLPSFSHFRNAQDLYFYENIFSGSVYSVFDNCCPALSVIGLDHNCFTASIPRAFASMYDLEQVFVNGNSFQGSLSNSFNLKQTKLQYIEVSENQLTGTIPNEIFSLSNLLTFSATSNCFTGSISSSICNSMNLQTLAIDGMHSASSCQLSFLKISSINTYLLNYYPSGGIPECLFSMSNIQTIHLSGNGLTGHSLSNLTNISASLSDLTLSHNVLTGAIPDVIQKRAWNNLDLSHNYFKASLSNHFSSMTINSTVSLDNNRISGKYPKSIVDAVNINVLAASLFSCSISKDGDLPKHDSNYDTYQCGSSTFDVAMIIYSVLFASALVTGATVCAIFAVDITSQHPEVASMTYYPKSVFIIKQIVDAAWQKINIDDPKLTYILYFKILNQFLCRAGSLCMVYLLALLLLYGILHTAYSSYNSVYGWSVSSAFLGSTVPGVLLFLVTVGLCILVYIISMSDALAVDAQQFETVQREAQSQELRAFGTVHVPTVIEEEPHNFCETDPQKNHSLTQPDLLKVNHRLLGYSKLAAVLIVNAIVLVLVNGIYVGLQIQGNQVFSQGQYIIIVIQIMFAIVKLLWNNWLLAELFVRIGFSASLEQSSAIISRSVLFQIHAATMMFNNIAIPCLVVMCVSSQCFYEVFNPSPSVKSSFNYGYCEKFNPVNGTGIGGVVNSTVVCTDFSYTAVQYTSFNAAFQYSYQCSSSFVTYYAGAFIYMFILNGIVGPALQTVLRFLLTTRVFRKTSRQYVMLKACVARLYRPVDKEEVSVLTPTNKGDYLLNCYWHQIQITTWLAMLLTFGAAFPPLGITIFTAMVVNGYLNVFAIKKLLCEARNLNCSAEYEDILQKDCKSAFNPLPHVRWLLLLFVCLFHTLFIFDTTGDEIGARHALWTIIITPALPIIFWLISKSRSVAKYTEMRLTLRNFLGVVIPSVSNHNDRSPLRDSVSDGQSQSDTAQMSL